MDTNCQPDLLDSCVKINLVYGRVMRALAHYAGVYQQVRPVYERIKRGLFGPLFKLRKVCGKCERGTTATRGPQLILKLVVTSR